MWHIYHKLTYFLVNVVVRTIYSCTIALQGANFGGAPPFQRAQKVNPSKSDDRVARASSEPRRKSCWFAERNYSGDLLVGDRRSDLGLRSRVTTSIRLGAHELLVKPMSAKTLQLRLLGIMLKPRPMVRAGKRAFFVGTVVCL
jgi:hypothetical protein